MAQDLRYQGFRWLEASDGNHTFPEYPMKPIAVALVFSVSVVMACGGEGADQESQVAALDTATLSTSGDTAMGGMAGSQQSAPQDADHEFLRMMSSHHEGLVAMGQDAMNRAVDDSVKSAAHHLHTKQAAERDTMVTMIQQMYNEQHQPMIMPKNAAQADSLRQMTGTAADRYFLQTTIAHHEEGMRMIDQFMQRFTKPQVRQMAEKMRADQQREIQELQAKLRQM